MVIVYSSTAEIPTEVQEPLQEEPNDQESKSDDILAAGQYEILQDTIVTEEPHENSNEVRLVEQGVILTVTEVVDVEGQILGRVDGGWIVLRDDMFERFAKPISRKSVIPEFGQLGKYRLLQSVEVTLERSPQSLEIRVAEEGEILDIRLIEEFDGFMRGKFFQGWITLRSDMYDKFAAIIGRLPASESAHCITEFGEPGKYEVIADCVCTEDLDPTSAEVRTLSIGEVLFVMEVKDWEDSFRGRVEDGWLTMRDDVFEYFAKPWDPEKQENRKRKKVPMIFTHSTFNLNSGWFKGASGGGIYKTIDSEQPFMTLSEDEEIHIITRNGKWAQINSPAQGYVKLTDDNDKVVIREIDYDDEHSHSDESEEESSDIIIDGSIGHTGMYEIIYSTIVNTDVNPDSSEVRTIEAGDIASVEELTRYQGSVRARIKDGWFTLRDDMFQQYANPIIHKFGEPGEYVMLEDQLAKHDCDPESYQMRFITEDETVKVRNIQEFNGFLRGECSYGWITLRDDKGSKLVRVKTNFSDVPDDIEMGEPGKYKLTVDGVLTKYRSADSEELCVISEGTEIRVLSVKDIEGIMRGKVEFNGNMGWLTLRDDLFDTFAQPSNAKEEKPQAVPKKVVILDKGSIGGRDIVSDYSIPDEIEEAPPDEPMTPPPPDAIKPGQYKIVQSVAVTSGISLYSKQSRTLPVDTNVFIVEIAKIQGNMRGRIDGGWITIRDKENNDYATLSSEFITPQAQDENTPNHVEEEPDEEVAQPVFYAPFQPRCSIC